MRSPEPPIASLVAEAQRVLAICNACRYCEGYCAVFPAIERRLSFARDDIGYLANLCHNCGSCLYACQYAPPHEFAVNFPRLMAEARLESYRRHAWPGALGGLFARNGRFVAGVLVLALAAAMALVLAAPGASRWTAAWSDAEGSFYALLPHGAMALSFAILFGLAIVAMAAGVARFWRSGEEAFSEALAPDVSAGAVHDALTLRYLGGGGPGCTYPDERPSFARRWFHHFTFYGFMLCFAATCAATFDHYVLGIPAPYPWASAPVVLGTLGGLGLLVGPIGLLALMARRDPELADPAQRGMDVTFLILLFATSVSGLALLALRETQAMGALLAIHLAIVGALFVTLPYGKLVHAAYRLAALARWRLERTRPGPGLGPE